MKNSLHHLVHSLGKNEKRHFRLFAQQGSKKGEHRMLMLFDKLASTPIGETFQIDRNDAGILRTDLPSAMYKLNQLLMKGLRLYHSGKSEGSRMRVAMDDIEILYRKGLFTECKRKIQKTRIRALEQEDFHVLLQLSDWDLQLIRSQPPSDPIAEMLKLNRNKGELLDRIREKEEYLAMYRMAFMVTKLRPTQKEAAGQQLLDEILESPKLKEDAPVHTLIGKLTRLLIPGLYAMGQARHLKAMESFDAGRAIFDRHRFLINTHPDIYRITLTNLLNACLFLGKQEKYKAILDGLPVIRMESPTDKRRLQILVYYSDLLYCLNFGDQERGTHLVHDIQAWTSRNLNELETDVLFNFFYNSCLFHFMHGHYKQAVLQLNHILNSKRQDLRQDIYDYAHLFQLVIHWELENFDLLEYQIQSVRRYLKTRELNREYEQRIIQFFVKAMDIVDPVQLKEHVAGLLDFLKSLLVSLGASPPLGCQELVFWLESKLAGKDIGDYYRERVKGSDRFE